MKFSDNLVKYRKKAGLTQGQLAAKLSVTPQAVSKWEKGSYPDSELLPELSKALDVSLDVLFGLKSDDGKINATNAAAKKMRSLSDEDKGQFIMELFYSLICTYRSPNHSPAKPTLICAQITPLPFQGSTPICSISAS